VECGHHISRGLCIYICFIFTLTSDDRKISALRNFSVYYYFNTWIFVAWKSCQTIISSRNYQRIYSADRTRCYFICSTSEKNCVQLSTSTLDAYCRMVRSGCDDLDGYTYIFRSSVGHPLNLILERKEIIFCNQCRNGCKLLKHTLTLKGGIKQETSLLTFNK